MNPTLQFFYDVSSPYSYLTFARIADVAEHYGVSVDYRPFLLGGVFHATNNQTPTTNLARAAYLRKDLARWAARDGIPFRFSDSFPHNSLFAMRCITAASHAEQQRVAAQLFNAAWVENLNLTDRDVVQSLLSNAPHLLEGAGDPAVKLRLRETTEAAVQAGAFGAPFFLVGTAEYWGNDRLEMAMSAAVTVQ